MVVHGLEDALLAIAAGESLTLISAPGAGSAIGAAWWRALMEAAGWTGPHILDCAADGAAALAALRLGQRLLVLDGPLAALVAQAASAQGAVILPARPPVLDLAEPGAPRRLDAWAKG